MTATYDQVKQALGTVLLTIPGLRVYPRLTPLINPPAAVVTPATGPFLTYRTSNISHDLDLAVTVFVQRGNDRSSDEELSAYIADSGPKSIYGVVDANSTLGGVVDGAWVTQAQDWGAYTVGDASYLGCVFLMQVLL
jgi:hypothetical protein